MAGSMAHVTRWVSRCGAWPMGARQGVELSAPRTLNSMILPWPGAGVDRNLRFVGIAHVLAVAAWNHTCGASAG